MLDDDIPSLSHVKCMYLRGLLSAMIANGNSYFPPIYSVISYENEPRDSQSGHPARLGCFVPSPAWVEQSLFVVTTRAGRLRWDGGRR